MANQGAKKRVEENAKRLSFLFQVILMATVIHCGVRLGVKRSSATWINYTAAAGSVAAQTFAYGVMKNAAAPTYGANGELIHAGADLKMGGIMEYCTDLILIVAVLQILTSISDWLWLLILVVPAFGLYMFWVHIAAPWIFAPVPEEEEETDAMRKKREKMERKANRQKVVYRR